MKLFRYIFLSLFTTVLLLIISCKDDDGPIDFAWNTCEHIEVSLVDSTAYHSSESLITPLNDFRVDGDCLGIKYNDCSGASFFGLVALEDFVQDDLPTWTIKFQKDCISVSDETSWAFDISPLRVSGEDSVILNLENWPDPIIYTY